MGRGWLCVGLEGASGCEALGSGRMVGEGKSALVDDEGGSAPAGRHSWSCSRRDFFMMSGSPRSSAASC